MNFFDPNYYGMFTDKGNYVIANLVDRARNDGMSWSDVQVELDRLGDNKETSEATDTDVREMVFAKLGFDKDPEVSFY